MTDLPDAARLAVLGSPIAHSKSPALHAAAYGVLGLDWEYSAIEVADGGLATFLRRPGRILARPVADDAAEARGAAAAR